MSDFRVVNAEKFEFQGCPGPKDGITFPGVEDLFGRLSDPRFRDAIDIVERSTGKMTGLKHQVRKQLVHDRIANMQAAVQKKRIDLALRRGVK